MRNLRKDMESAINGNSAENGSDTPDFILAGFLLGALTLFDGAVNERERWYQRRPGEPGAYLNIGEVADGNDYGGEPIGSAASYNVATDSVSIPFDELADAISLARQAGSRMQNIFEAAQRRATPSHTKAAQPAQEQVHDEAYERHVKRTSGQHRDSGILEPKTRSANEYQPGGDHYRRGGALQHWDLINATGAHYLVGCASKYVSRWRRKDGAIDLDKALHYLHKAEESGVGPALNVRPTTIMEFAVANELEPLEISAIWSMLEADWPTALNAIYKLKETVAVQEA